MLCVSLCVCETLCSRGIKTQRIDNIKIFSGVGKLNGIALARSPSLTRYGVYYQEKAGRLPKGKTNAPKQINSERRVKVNQKL